MSQSGAKIDAAIETSRAEMSALQTRMANVTSQFEAGSDVGRAEIDVENATLADVIAHQEQMNGNIADLIMGLDDVTAGFSKDFDSLRTKTSAEKLIGFFAKGKSESMRQERLRAASIDDKLQDLIGKSDNIVVLLKGQLAVVQEQHAKVEKNLASTLEEREQVVAQQLEARAKISSMDPKLIDLENRIAAEQDAGARTKLEGELAAMNAEYNALVQEEQVKTAESLTLERYIEKGKTWVDSLQNQVSTQMVLISKLETDTRQRVVLYDALTKSLKTAQQQEIAHRINEIGVQTDQEAQAAMAAIASAANTRMADMMESHEGHMVFSREILAQKAKADERFARRFEAVLEKHDRNLYGA